jgi:hypothetical protein
MTQLYEYYNTNPNGGGPAIYGVYWSAETFTVGADGHTVEYVKLKMYRAGSPGTVTVSIRAVDASDKPAYMVTAAWPYVNTPLHIGHLRAFGTADALARYKRMRNYSVFYPFGLDNNGLPTELLIEKKHNMSAEQIGREKFVQLGNKEIEIVILIGPVRKASSIQIVPEHSKPSLGEPLEGRIPDIVGH